MQLQSQFQVCWVQLPSPRRRLQLFSFLVNLQKHFFFLQVHQNVLRPIHASPPFPSLPILILILLHVFFPVFFFRHRLSFLFFLLRFGDALLASELFHRFFPLLFLEFTHLFLFLKYALAHLQILQFFFFFNSCEFLLEHFEHFFDIFVVS